MDFDESPEEAAFRLEARAWLEANAPLRTEEVPTSKHLDYDQHVAASIRWQQTLADAGWAGIAWPKEFGGRGERPAMQGIFEQEQARFDVAYGPLMVGLGMVGPTLIAHGTPEQRDRFLGPMLRGDELWCQLFSEPEAGSDLASLRTTAVRDGDTFVVNGQKLWTSMAQYAQWGILLARTDPSAPKHHGISYFLVDMHQPGIEVRPLRQITGIAHFNEVFLTDVRVEAKHLVGELHEGWRVARTTLANERSAIGGGRAGASWDALLELARTTGGAADPLVRQRLAAIYTRAQLLRFLGYRAKTASAKGVPPGPEASVMKLLVGRQAAAVGDLALELQGPGGAIADDWTTGFLNQWAIRIGGGTDEIQRNVIGERVLGLPTEPR